MITLENIFEKIKVSADAWNLSKKNANTLRLLGEEMVGMTENLIDVTDLDFSVKSDGKCFELCLSAKANISPEKKSEFVAAASSKKNESEKGFKGKLKSIFENLFYGDSALASSGIGMYAGSMGAYQAMWSLDSYMKNASESERKKDSDGLEKSILENFADDIIIGATTEKIEMIVKKTF